MNLNELWSGTDYAYYEWKGRGEIYRAGAQRVKVIRAFKERVGDNDRMSGFADVLVCDPETGDILTRPYNPDEQWRMKVRARDIAMRWEEYEELDAQDKERRRKAQEERDRLRKEREERYRIQEEERRKRIEAEEAERKRLVELEQQKRENVKRILIEKYGIPEHYITTVDGYYVHINRAELEKELEGIVATS